MADILVTLGMPFLSAAGYGDGRDTGGHAAAPVPRPRFEPQALVVAVGAFASM